MGLDKRVHLFAAADRSHSASDEIYLLLDEIYEQMRLAGEVHDTKSYSSGAYHQMLNREVFE